MNVRNRITWRVAVIAAAALVVAALIPEHFLSRSDNSVRPTGEWYALNSPNGNCARLYKEEPLQQFEFVICRRSGQPFTCWERERPA